MRTPSALPPPAKTPGARPSSSASPAIRATSTKALLQFQYILDHQHADGYMLGEGVADESGQPKRTTYDYTADFTSWLIDGAAELASRGR